MTYLIIITTVLVLTQIARVAQNATQLKLYIDRRVNETNYTRNANS